MCFTQDECATPVHRGTDATCLMIPAHGSLEPLKMRWCAFLQDQRKKETMGTSSMSGSNVPADSLFHVEDGARSSFFSWGNNGDLRPGTRLRGPSPQRPKYSDGACQPLHRGQRFCPMWSCPWCATCSNGTTVRIWTRRGVVRAKTIDLRHVQTWHPLFLVSGGTSNLKQHTTVMKRDPSSLAVILQLSVTGSRLNEHIVDATRRTLGNDRLSER